MKVRKQAASLVGKTEGLGKVLFGKKNADEEVKNEEASGEGNKCKMIDLYPACCQYLLVRTWK
jgi:hypothetical protein